MAEDFNNKELNKMIEDEVREVMSLIKTMLEKDSIITFIPLVREDFNNSIYDYISNFVFSSADGTQSDQELEKIVNEEYINFKKFLDEHDDRGVQYIRSHFRQEILTSLVRKMEDYMTNVSFCAYMMNLKEIKDNKESVEEVTMEKDIFLQFTHEYLSDNIIMATYDTYTFSALNKCIDAIILEDGNLMKEGARELVIALGLDKLKEDE